MFYNNVFTMYIKKILNHGHDELHQVYFIQFDVYIIAAYETTIFNFH